MLPLDSVQKPESRGFGENLKECASQLPGNDGVESVVNQRFTRGTLVMSLSGCLPR